MKRSIAVSMTVLLLCSACAPTLDGSDLDSFSDSLQTVSDGRSPEERRDFNNGLAALGHNIHIGELRRKVDGMTFDQVIEEGRVKAVEIEIEGLSKDIREWDEIIAKEQQEFDAAIALAAEGAKFTFAFMNAAGDYDGSVLVKNGSSLRITYARFEYGAAESFDFVFEPALMPGEERTIIYTRRTPDLSQGWKFDSFSLDDGTHVSVAAASEHSAARLDGFKRDREEVVVKLGAARAKRETLG